MDSNVNLKNPQLIGKHILHMQDIQLHTLDMCEIKNVFPYQLNVEQFILSVTNEMLSRGNTKRRILNAKHKGVNGERQEDYFAVFAP